MSFKQKFPLPFFKDRQLNITLSREQDKVLH